MAKIEPVGQRYSFEVLVKSVTLTLPGSIKIFIILSYDHKKLEGKSHLQIDKMNTVANFNETFELATVLYKIQGNMKGHFFMCHFTCSTFGSGVQSVYSFLPTGRPWSPCR